MSDSQDADAESSLEVSDFEDTNPMSLYEEFASSESFVGPIFPRPTPGLAEKLQKQQHEFKELVRLAAPIFKRKLSHLPYYQKRMDDDYFWRMHISSEIVGAQRLVAKHCGVFIPLQCHETPNAEVQKSLDDWKASQL